MWRLIRIAVLYTSAAITLSWLLAFMPVITWLVLLLIPVALVDLWVESVKGR